MTGRCEHCSKVGDSMHASTRPGLVRCDDVSACQRRAEELKSAEAWYACEVYRMKERAPA